jgi:hypothetical protein
MSETIRYAWGRSSLGDFILAVLATGVFEFAKKTIAQAGPLQ